jgi:hypothetical protein
MDELLRRRLKILLDEVRSVDWRRDSVAVFCQRTLSNYFTTGKDGLRDSEKGRTRG